MRKVHGEVVGYFENHVHRMDYPTYRAKGWAIGSGPIESACKTVIGKRMKNGGMRWGEDGADEMCICVPCSPAEKNSGMPTGTPAKTEQTLYPQKCYLPCGDSTR